MTKTQAPIPSLTLVPRHQPKLYADDILLPDESRDVRSLARAFADRIVAPRAYEIGHADEAAVDFPRDVFGEMAAAGLFRVPFAAADGGRGLANPALATALVIEELAYHSNSVAAIYDVHCILAGHALKRASPELRERYLKPLLDGTKIGSFATTEAEASTDLSVGALQTGVRESDGGFLISGSKRFITNAPVADFVVLLCRDGERMSLVVVDLDLPGVRVGRPDRKLGNNGQLTADLYFDDVVISDSQVIGERGTGLRVALQTLTYGRIGIAASGVGMAQALFDHCVERLKTRRAFGKSLAQFQHWQFKLAERATQIENARNLYYKAARQLDAGLDFPEPLAAMAKYYATDLAAAFARDGVQIFGGYGFMRELGHDASRYRVEEIYRDAKIAEIYEGTNEIQKWIVARSIFGKEFTG
jgi:alkylation response protein AidB-like acyl-CoA dehydrogenase